ncbi:MAG: GntR family transcriptional regulator [Micropruina sp.]
MKVPKYYQIKGEILALIDDLPTGSAVPTERELATRFDTSRTTVRQAIAELVVDGKLVRTQGSGTFVAQPKMMRVRPLSSFSQDLAMDGWRPGSQVLDITEETADAELAEHLGVQQGTPSSRSSGCAPPSMSRSRTRWPTCRASCRGWRSSWPSVVRCTAPCARSAARW